MRRTDLNSWYVPASYDIRVGWLGRLQFLRKYYLSMPFRRIRDGIRRVRSYLNLWPPRRDS
jgi:hypothetical protein